MCESYHAAARRSSELGWPSRPPPVLRRPRTVHREARCLSEGVVCGIALTVATVGVREEPVVCESYHAAARRSSELGWPCPDLPQCSAGRGRCTEKEVVSRRASSAGSHSPLLATVGVREEPVVCESYHAAARRSSELEWPSRPPPVLRRPQTVRASCEQCLFTPAAVNRWADPYRAVQLLFYSLFTSHVEATRPPPRAAPPLPHPSHHTTPPTTPPRRHPCACQVFLTVTVDTVVAAALLQDWPAATPPSPSLPFVARLPTRRRVPLGPQAELSRHRHPAVNSVPSHL